MDFLPTPSLSSQCPGNLLRTGLLVSVCLLTACQTGISGRAVFQRVEIESVAAPGARLELVDVGGNHAPDIVLMTQRPGRLHWYENPVWSARQIPVVADEFFGLAALPPQEADAVADLAVNGRFSQPGAGTRQQLVRLHNPGRMQPDQAWSISVVRSETAPGALFAADMSGTGQRLLGSLPDLAIHTPARTRAQWVSLPLLANPPANARVRVFDWDLNGRDDLLVISDRGLDILALASRSRFVDEFRLFATEQGQGFLDVGVGQSGRPARRFIAALSEDGSRLQVFRPDAETGTRWSARTLADSLGGARVLKVADLNRDAFDEIVVGGDSGLHVYYYDAVESQWHRYQLDGHAVSDMAVADLSGNGFPDMVTAPADTGAVRLFQNRGRSN